jgi:hypothetical protein
MIIDALEMLQAAPQPGGGLIQFLPMVFIFVIFYFLLIAPMRKRQKRQQQMISQLKKGDEVVTSGGIFGLRRNARRGHPADRGQREGQGPAKRHLRAGKRARIERTDHGHIGRAISYQVSARARPGQLRADSRQLIR